MIYEYRNSYENGIYLPTKKHLSLVNYFDKIKWISTEIGDNVRSDYPQRHLQNYQFESLTMLQTFCRLSGWNIFNYPSLSLIATFTFKGQNEGHRTPSSIFCKGNSFLDRCNTKYSKNRMFQITIPPGQKYAFVTPF